MNFFDLNVNLGLKIKQCRNNLAITQEQLSEILDISQSYLGQIERGARGINLENLIKLANALNVSIDFLVSDYLTVNPNSLDAKWNSFILGKSSSEKEKFIALIKDLEKYFI